MSIDYTPNSIKANPEQSAAPVEKKKVEKVITGTAKRKPDTARKLTNLFAPGDMSSISEYIIMDVIVPATKKMISEIVRNGIDMVLYGESGRSKNYTGSSDKVSYRSYYGSNDSSRSNSSTKTRSVFDYDNISIPTRQEAEEVIRRMDEIIEVYGMVSVADLYDLCGITDHNYMNAKYGWMNIRTAEAVRVRDGYILKLPRALPLDRN
ncbi:MAG: hypothetical protein J6Q60_05840 [Bacteroidaceae bacterium]|nr:hypothetical protein [Bacteroidaceae bacterium]